MGAWTLSPTVQETIPDDEASYEVRVERARELGFGPPVERLFADIEAPSRDVAFAGPLIVDHSSGVVSVCLARSRRPGRARHETDRYP